MKFVYGVARVRIGDQTLGYIQKGTFKLNGTPGTSTPIEAEQVPGTPVWTIPVSNGTIAPSFGLIQWDYDQMAELMGGRVVKDEANKATGWRAPGGLVEGRGKVIIETVSRKRISLFNALVQANPDGGLDLTSVAQINVETKPQMPEDGDEPWGMDDITDAEWAQIMAEEKAKKVAIDAAGAGI